MQETETKTLVQRVIIKTPCSVGWENMEGDDKVRFCGECKLNVHNLSNMSDKEASKLLSQRNDRLCVFLTRRRDGSVMTDNCPAKFRAIRNRIRAYAAITLIAFTWLCARSLSAQGLAGDAIDPRYGMSGEVSTGLADYGYETARDISNIATWISFILAFFVPMDQKKSENLKLIAFEFIALACIPILIHFAGTLVVNNYGSTGGGL